MSAARPTWSIDSMTSYACHDAAEGFRLRICTVATGAGWAWGVIADYGHGVCVAHGFTRSSSSAKSSARKALAAHVAARLVTAG